MDSKFIYDISKSAPLLLDIFQPKAYFDIENDIPLGFSHITST